MPANRCQWYARAKLPRTQLRKTEYSTRGIPTARASSQRTVAYRGRSLVHRERRLQPPGCAHSANFRCARKKVPSSNARDTCIHHLSLPSLPGSHTARPSNPVPPFHHFLRHLVQDTLNRSSRTLPEHEFHDARRCNCLVDEPPIYPPGPTREPRPGLRLYRSFNPPFPRLLQ